jgi:hypothetical protein
MLLLYVYYFAIDDIQPLLQRIDALALEIVDIIVYFFFFI